MACVPDDIPLDQGTPSVAGTPGAEVNAQSAIDAAASPSTAGPASAAAMAAQLCADLKEQWLRGERPPAECYLEDYLAHHSDLEYAVDMPYAELRVRQELGESPDVEEFTHRFPQFSAQLRLHAKLLQAIGASADFGYCDQPRAKEGWPDAPGYEIEGELGRGGMSVVYKARQSALKRSVALKMLEVHSQPGLSRFRLEAEAAARLQHPNVVQIYEVGETSGRPFIVMELVTGSSLAQRLADSPLDPIAAASLVETLARAVEYAHECGVVHRDLKPANVLLAGAAPKLTDFGLAKRIGLEDGQTQSGDIIGTPSYMAPEQAAGDGKLAGPGADVYALGAILFECLTGRSPFKGSTTFETLRQVMYEPPVSPRRLRRRVPRDLDTICLKCLEKAPQHRYASAKNLAEDLRRFIDGRPILARPAGPMRIALKWAARRPALTALIAAIFALVCIVSGGVIVQQRQLFRRMAVAADEVRADLVRADGFLGQERWTDGIATLERAAVRVKEARSADLFSRVQAGLRDLRLAKELDRVRMLRLSPMIGDFTGELRRTSDSYAKAFREAGFEITSGDTEAIVKQINNSPIRAQILVAIEEWAMTENPMPDRSMCARLLELSRRSDPHPGGGDQIRDAAAWAHRPGLERLYAQVVDGSLDPPARLRLRLADVLMQKGGADIRPLIIPALQGNPGDFWIHWQLARTMRDLSVFDQAVGHFRAALVSRPSDPTVLVGLADALRSVKQFEEALATARTAVRVAPDDPAARCELGMVLKDQGKVDKAILELRRSIELSKDTRAARALDALGQILVKRAEWDEAVRLYRRAAKDEPRSSRIRISLGDALEGGGRADEALAVYQAAASEFTWDALAHFRLGAALLKRGDGVGAIAAQRRAVSASRGIKIPDDEHEAWERFSETVRLLATTRPAVPAQEYARRRDWTSAATWYGQEANYAPGLTGDFWFECSAVRILAGDDVGYKTARMMMLDGAGKTAGMRPYLIARTCTLIPSDQPTIGRASVIAGPELRKAPQAFWSLTQRGALELRAGRPERAISLLREGLAADQSPGRAVVARLWLSLALAAVGQAEEARLHYGEATRWMDANDGGMPSRGTEGGMGQHLHNGLEAAILRREAREVFERDSRPKD